MLHNPMRTRIQTPGAVLQPTLRSHSSSIILRLSRYRNLFLMVSRHRQALHRPIQRQDINHHIMDTHHNLLRH